MIHQRQHFVDWMKAFGMFLIVYGHVVGNPYNIFNAMSQPIYTKQLGVAFFVFITGWGLANEKRPALRVVFNRIFPVYFYGVLGAITASILFFIIKGDINESNYMPFVFGINVFVNYFPANPTTWYIGFYLHMILFWAFFLHNRTVEGKHIVVAFIIENLSRIALIKLNQDFTAYMMLTNWITIFLLGHWLHQKKDIKQQPVFTTVALLVWLSLLCIWGFVGSPWMDKSFPFRGFTGDFPLEVTLRSLLVSTIYLLNTWVFFEIFRRLRSNSMVTFFARNTIIIFIAHMLVVYSFAKWFYQAMDMPIWFEKAVLILILYAGIGLLSEIIEKAVNVKRIREYTWYTLHPYVCNILKKTGFPKRLWEV